MGTPSLSTQQSTHMLSTARLDAMGHCWLAALASYDFDIKYHPAVNNADAEALSRLPAVHKSQTVRAVCSSLQTESYMECLTLSAKVIVIM